MTNWGYRLIFLFVGFPFFLPSHYLLNYLGCGYDSLLAYLKLVMIIQAGDVNQELSFKETVMIADKPYNICLHNLFTQIFMCACIKVWKIVKKILVQSSVIFVG